MAKLVAHKVQITTVHGGRRHEADHLMKGQATLYGEVSVVRLHVPIHIRVDEPEDNRLVTHKRLVVALRIADRLLIRAPIRGLPPNGRRMPVLVLLLLECFDPKIGDIHGHSVVEIVAPVLESGSQAWHTAHLLGDRHRVRVDLVNQPVGEGQVDDRIAILMAVVIVAVVAKGFPEAVAIVKHGGNAIEAESVETILVEPEFAVRKQKMKHLVTPVIEAKRIPSAVLTPFSGVKILVVRSVKASQAFRLILDRVAMHNVHNHG